MAKKNSHKLKIYIASELVESSPGDPQISRETKGKRVSGLISFSIPDYSIIFRCRIICPEKAVTATAAVTALRFLETTLSGLRVDAVEVVTDSPEFFLEAGGHLPQAYGAGRVSENSSRGKILKEYREKYKLSFALVKKVNNLARANSADVSCAPADTIPPLRFDPKDWSSVGKVLPLQGGIEM